MPAPPARSSISGTPTNAAANTGFGALWDYVTGLLGMSGSAADARTALEAAKSGAVTGSGLTMTTARALGRLTAGTGAPEELTSAQFTANLVDAASTSAPGKVELATDAEAQAGIDPARALTPASLKAAQIQRASVVTLTTQTAVDFTGIPSWASRLTLEFVDVSLNGAAPITIQGGNGSFENTGYVGDIVTLAGSVANGGTTTSSFFATASITSGASVSGKIVFEKQSGNLWVQTGVLSNTVGPAMIVTSGRKNFSSTLERLRATAGGSVQFDAGTINLSWE